MPRVRRVLLALVAALTLAVIAAAPAVADGGPGDPPDSCFRTNANGDLPTCSWDGSSWHRSYETATPTGGGAGGFAGLFVLAVLAGIGFTVWKVSTARRMARESGMSEGDATAMALLTDDGFEATYLASNLRPRPDQAPAPAAAPPAATAAARLRALRELLDEGLITQAEYDDRRRAILEET
jgi:hypothetical protein